MCYEWVFSYFFRLQQPQPHILLVTAHIINKVDHSCYSCCHVYNSNPKHTSQPLSLLRRRGRTIGKNFYTKLRYADLYNEKKFVTNGVKLNCGK